MDPWQKTIQPTVRFPIVTPWAVSQKVLARQENDPLIFNLHHSRAEASWKADPLTTPVLSLPIFFDTIDNSLVVDNLRSLMTPFDLPATIRFAYDKGIPCVLPDGFPSDASVIYWSLPPWSH